jgi:hypothetical protein
VQGQNIGASNATITGTLIFEGYPCLNTASVNGQISGNSVLLQIIASNGLNVGQIGSPPGLAAGSLPAPVTFASQPQGGGYVLSGASGYAANTKGCPGVSLNNSGDHGNICLALGSATSCTQPISLFPLALVFPPQLVGSAPTTQAITLTNTDPAGSTLTGLSLSLAAANSPFGGASDFNGLPNFAEQDTCATTPGSSFNLGPLQSCTITISFSPQQGCTWLPNSLSGNNGVPPAQCPPDLGKTVPVPPGLAAILTVNSPTSADPDKAFAVPITGVGFSAIIASPPELDFGAEALSESSLPQLVTFTNAGTLPVQILPAATTPCANPKTVGQHLTLQRPLQPGEVDGVRVLTADIQPLQSPSTIQYLCDLDLTSAQQNFRISSDACTGTLLAPQQSCSLNVTYEPQPFAFSLGALDYFLELNTLQCTTTSPPPYCEIDSGRFPVELRANGPSPLRMSPGAGLDFGNQAVDKPTAPMTITLFNDPNDPNAATLNFTGNVVKGDYTESDDCPSALPPGGSCTMTVTFLPTVKGYDPGNITITYSPQQFQRVYLRGTGQ